MGDETVDELGNDVEAVSAPVATGRPLPTDAVFSGRESIADRVDELLADGFGT